MKYENPKMTITSFSKESIVTLSSADMQTDAVKTVLGQMQSNGKDYKSIMIFQ